MDRTVKSNELFDRGYELHKKNKILEASVFYKSALKENSKNFRALLLLGILEYGLKNFRVSANLLKIAIDINPNSDLAFFNYGAALHSLNDLELAIQSYDKAININPDYAEAYSNKGVALQMLNQLKEALKSYDEAIKINPNYAEAYSNRGLVLKELNELDSAIDSFDKAIKINPSFAFANWNRAILALLLGDFEKGWDLYRWRWKCQPLVLKKKNFSIPLWTGKEDIKNKIILVYCEQGLGDIIQFSRYIKLLKLAGARILFEIPKKLTGLFHNFHGVDELIVDTKFLPNFDLHCSLLDLPKNFKTNLKTIPNDIPYLSVNFERINKWKNIIGNDGFKIAICWQGNEKAKADKGRSFSVNLFKKISRIKGVRLISLQKNYGTSELHEASSSLKVEKLPETFDEGDNAFLDSAAVMRCVDLVITSDTALTHLAGALGVKTWLALQYVPDWRWLLDREDSPWYPNHKIFRQKKLNDWSSVFKKMYTELKLLV